MNSKKTFTAKLTQKELARFRKIAAEKCRTMCAQLRAWIRDGQ